MQSRLHCELLQKQPTNQSSTLKTQVAILWIADLGVSPTEQGGAYFHVDVPWAMSTIAPSSAFAFN